MFAYTTWSVVPRGIDAIKATIVNQYYSRKSLTWLLLIIVNIYIYAYICTYIFPAISVDKI